MITTLLILLLNPLMVLLDAGANEGTRTTGKLDMQTIGSASRMARFVLGCGAGNPVFK